MTRLVLDTNQLIAGVLWPDGPAGFIFETWRKRRLEIVVSPPILAETGGVLSTKFEKGREAADYLKDMLLFNSVLVLPQEKIDAVKEDPSDNIFLEAAVAAQADFLVSRDNHLFRLENFRNTKIVPPERMAQWIRKNVK